MTYPTRSDLATAYVDAYAVGRPDTADVVVTIAERYPVLGLPTAAEIRTPLADALVGALWDHECWGVDEPTMGDLIRLTGALWRTLIAHGFEPAQVLTVAEVREVLAEVDPDMAWHVAEVVSADLDDASARAFVAEHMTSVEVADIVAEYVDAGGPPPPGFDPVWQAWLTAMQTNVMDLAERAERLFVEAVS